MVGSLEGASLPLEDTFCQRMLRGSDRQLRQRRAGRRPRQRPSDGPAASASGPGSEPRSSSQTPQVYVLCCLAREARPSLGEREVRLIVGLAESRPSRTGRRPHPSSTLSARAARARSGRGARVVAAVGLGVVQRVVGATEDRLQRLAVTAHGQAGRARLAVGDRQTQPLGDLGRPRSGEQPTSSRPNSSPPSRASRSPARSRSRQLAAVSRSSRSPARWPLVSLKRLKWSRSNIAIVTGSSSIAARLSRASQARRLGRPVSGSVSAIPVSIVSSSARPMTSAASWASSSTTASMARRDRDGGAPGDDEHADRLLTTHQRLEQHRCGPSAELPQLRRRRSAA